MNTQQTVVDVFFPAGTLPHARRGTLDAMIYWVSPPTPVGQVMKSAS